MPKSGSAIVKAKPQGRSRVGNGKTLLSGADGRSLIVRRFKEILAAISADLGGNLSEAKMTIARRAATLAVWCETQEAELARNRQIDISAFTTATNSLRRLLLDLGLERRTKDITPDLDDYLRDQYAEAGE